MPCPFFLCPCSLFLLLPFAVIPSEVNVCLGLAGLPAVISSLRTGHRSSTRILEVFSLEPLEWEDRMEVVRRVLAESNKKSTGWTKITPEAEADIASLSEGYPHFIQQFAYSWTMSWDGTFDEGAGGAF